MSFFKVIFYQPLWNALVYLYNIVPGHDLGVAIILLTILLKIILYPFTIQSLRSQRAMQALQPKLEALKQQYKNDKEGLAKAMMELYQKEKVSPFSSCLPLLVQLPFLFALYQVLRDGFGSEAPKFLYSFVANPGPLDPHFFGLDLGKPSYVLAVLAGLTQFWQTKLMQVKPPPRAVIKTEGAKDESMMAMMNKQMLYVMPIMTVVIAAGLPGGLALYWFVMSLLSAFQQKLFLRRK